MPEPRNVQPNPQVWGGDKPYEYLHYEDSSDFVGVLDILSQTVPAGKTREETLAILLRVSDVIRDTLISRSGVVTER